MKNLAKNNTRTVIEYRTLNARLLHDLKQSVDLVMSRMSKPLDDDMYYNKYLSDNALFYVQGYSIYAMTQANGRDRYDTQRYNGNRWYEWLDGDGNSINIGYYYGDNDYYATNGLDLCKEWLNQHLFEQYGFDPKPRDSEGNFTVSYFYRTTCYYSKNKLVNCDELRDILNQKFGDNFIFSK